MIPNTIKETVVNTVINIAAKAAINKYRVQNNKNYYIPDLESYCEKFVNMSLKVEKAFTKDLKSFFKDQYREVIGRITVLNLAEHLSPLTQKAPSSARINPVWYNWIFDEKEWNEELRKRGQDFITEVVMLYGPEAVSFLKSIVNPGFEMAFSIYNPNVSTFIVSQSYQFAKDVNQTTGQAIGRELEAGMKEGETIEEIASRIGDVFSNANKYRSTLIARTEVMRAANWATLETYKQSGVVAYKMWATSGDDRSCIECLEMDGKLMRLSDPFIVPVGTNLENYAE
jgi:SPP1 gp7 family putative phage head morphogenesis protein